MEDEFDKLMALFSKETENREKMLAEIFERSMEFFDKYKYILSIGTEAEKVAMQKKMDLFRERLEEEKEKSESLLGISGDDIKFLVANPENFTPEQWEFMKRAEEKLASTQEEKKEKEGGGDLKKKAKGVRKSGWLKS